jgi:ubiquinone/menaquinone biosynthesis C-methylase UbiE
MDERPERLKNPPDWETIYSERNLPYIPWNSDKPDLELVELIESKKILPSYVLDVGYGTGTDAIYLASKGSSVTAIDISREAIRIAAARAEKAGVKVNFIVGDFLEVELENERFDFVNDRGCFHIMSPLRRDDFVEKVSRLLKSQGSYYLRCWSDKQEFETEGTPYRISKDIIYRTFSKFFDIEEIKDIRWGGKGPRSYVCLMNKRVL